MHFQDLDFVLGKDDAMIEHKHSNHFGVMVHQRNMLQIAKRSKIWNIAEIQVKIKHPVGIGHYREKDVVHRLVLSDSYNYQDTAIIFECNERRGSLRNRGRDPLSLTKDPIISFKMGIDKAKGSIWILRASMILTDASMAGESEGTDILFECPCTASRVGMDLPYSDLSRSSKT